MRLGGRVGQSEPPDVPTRAEPPESIELQLSGALPTAFHFHSLFITSTLPSSSSISIHSNGNSFQRSLRRAGMTSHCHTADAFDDLLAP